jgi:hypothetical protein
MSRILLTVRHQVVSDCFPSAKYDAPAAQGIERWTPEPFFRKP